MECKTCHATIADKAIVCYRCGTPTAVPVAPVRSNPRPRTPRMLVGAALLAAVALAIVALSRPAWSPAQIAAGVGAIAAVAAAMWAAARR